MNVSPHLSVGTFTSLTGRTSIVHDNRPSLDVVSDVEVIVRVMRTLSDLSGFDSDLGWIVGTLLFATSDRVMSFSATD